MQELLGRVFENLNRGNIQYCLLRGYEELDEIENDGDVDLLVQSTQIDQVNTILTQLDFVRLPAWGREPHQFFVAYDPANDRWLKLDLVTIVAFGNPIHAIH